MLLSQLLLDRLLDTQTGAENHGYRAAPCVGNPHPDSTEGGAMDDCWDGRGQGQQCRPLSKAPGVRGGSGGQSPGLLKFHLTRVLNYHLSQACAPGL